MTFANDSGNNKKKLWHNRRRKMFKEVVGRAA